MEPPETIDARATVNLRLQVAYYRSIGAVVGFAESMTWNGKHHIIRVVETTFAKGVPWKPEAIKAVESEVIRLPTLEKGFVEISGEVQDGSLLSNRDAVGRRFEFCRAC